MNRTISSAVGPGHRSAPVHLTRAAEESGFSHQSGKYICDLHNCHFLFGLHVFKSEAARVAGGISADPMF